jgi:hypothetical protein
MSDRGQAYSLQGVIGAIIIVSALVLGLQAISIVPFADDGPSQGVDTKTQLEDTLSILEDNGGLKKSLLCLGGSNQRTPNSRIISTDPPVDPIGTVLNATASQTGNYNIYVVHDNGNKQLPIGPEGSITDSAVSVTREVVIFDSDPVYELDQTENECVVDGAYENVSNADDRGDIYLDNHDENSDIFQVVQIRVVAW